MKLSRGITAVLPFLVLGVLASPALPQAAAAAPKPQARVRKTVGILVFPGVQIIDYSGPFETFGAAGFDPFIVGETLDPIVTAMGQTIIPRYTFASCPKLDVLVVPGGGGSGPGMPGVGKVLENAAALDFVRERNKSTEITLSVCNGAFILAKAGLLDGLIATTFSGGIPGLRADYPGIKEVVSDQRFVDNGHIITTAGLSSGIDGSLHVVERLMGKGSAQRAALGMEYDWRPDSGFARASLADILMRPAIKGGFDIPEDNTWIVEADQGDRSHWTKAFSVTYPGITPSGLLEIVDKRLAETWTKGASHSGDASGQTQWTFKDSRGQSWAGVTEVKMTDAAKKLYSLQVRIEKG